MLNALSNMQVARAKEADIELDMFDNYEEYLDSKLEEAERRQDAIDRAYHRLQLLWTLDPQGPLLTDKEFNRAKEALGPEEKATKRGSRDLSEVVPRLEQICKQQEESGGQHLLLYLHVVHASGAEVSGHIDLSDRLTDPEFLPELRHRGGLVPVPGDLTFYNWSTSSLRFLLLNGFYHHQFKYLPIMVWGIGGDHPHHHPHHGQQVLFLPPLGGSGGKHGDLAAPSNHWDSPSRKNFIIVEN